jgi:hypothetical protein
MSVNHIPQIGTDWQLTRCNARADSASRTRPHPSKLRCASKSWSTVSARPTANWSPWFCSHPHTIFSSKWPIRWCCECGQHHWQMPLCSEEMEQGVLVVGSWTEPQNRGIRRGFCCWWRKNLGLERARATKYSPRQSEASEECPLCTKKPCSGSSPARRLEYWLSSEATVRVIKQYSCFWLRQCLGIQWANAQECTHIVRARDVESILFAEQDMFWKQSSTEGVTEGLAGRRRGCMVVGDIVGKDHRKK